MKVTATAEEVPGDDSPRLTREQWAAHYKSDRWVSLRTLARVQLLYRCADCGRSRGVKLHLHHKHYLTFGRETVDDLEWLCSRCHRRRHRRSSAGRPRSSPLSPVNRSAAFHPTAR